MTNETNPERSAYDMAKAAAQKVIDETKTPCLSISLEEEPLSIFDSKVGGLPYLPKNFTIPLDKDGRQMQLLAQIDCAELEALPDYPHEGMLQFWMSDKWAWEEAIVLYHKTIDRTVTEDSVTTKIQVYKKDNAHSFPVIGSYRMRFTLSEESMTNNDCRLKSLFCQYYTELSGKYISDPEDAESPDIYDVFVGDCEERDGAFGNFHKVGGYPYSTQFNDWDYCEYERGKEFDIHADDAPMMLFQLCSDFAPVNFATRTHDWIKVMWCDSGVGRFFIKRMDLKQCAFEKAWFSWDCC